MAANDLCPELLDKIFTFLKLKDIETVTQVCRYWKSIAKIWLKRRLFFEVHHERGYTPTRTTYLLQLHEHEHKRQNKEWQNEQALYLEELKSGRFPDTRLLIRSYQNLLPLAPLIMHADWCYKVTTLSLWTLTVQDWNAAGIYILSKFFSLERLELKLKWVFNYVSTLEVETVSPETNFDTIEHVTIVVCRPDMREDDVEKQEEAAMPCNQPDFQFVARCPNLKKFEISIWHFATYCYCCNRNNEKSIDIYYSHMFSGYYLCTFYPQVEYVVNTLPFTNCQDGTCNMDFLHCFGPQITKSIRTLKVGMRPKLEDMPVANRVDFVMKRLQNQDFPALQNLVFQWNTRFWKYQKSGDQKVSRRRSQLPNIKTLRMDIRAEGSQLALDCSPIYQQILPLLPNVQMLFVESFFLRKTSFEYKPSTLCILQGSFLEQTLQLNNLRHLVWYWEFPLTGFIEVQALNKISSDLARQPALESLTILFDYYTIYERVRAVIKGCTAAPRMRLLQLYIESSDELDKYEKLNNLKPKASKFCFIVSRHPDPSNEIFRFKVDYLNQICEELAFVNSALDGLPLTRATRKRSSSF